MPNGRDACLARIATLSTHVPFMTESELVRKGARYEKAPEPWAAFAVADGRLITGQNPASGGRVASWWPMPSEADVVRRSTAGRSPR
jgi:putative intracellular protease/amidase